MKLSVSQANTCATFATARFQLDIVFNALKKQIINSVCFCRFGTRS